MKISIVALLLVLVLFMTNFAASNYNRVADEMTANVDEAYNDAVSDKQKATDAMMSAMGVMDKYEFFLAATIHHEELDQIDNMLLDAKAYLESGDVTRFRAEVYKIKDRMEKLKKIEDIALVNIF